jgi:hypothetical protein
MTLVSGLIHSADNCASSANRKKFRLSLEVSHFEAKHKMESVSSFLERRKCSEYDVITHFITTHVIIQTVTFWAPREISDLMP